MKNYSLGQRIRLKLAEDLTVIGEITDVFEIAPNDTVYECTCDCGTVNLDKSGKIISGSEPDEVIKKRHISKKMKEMKYGISESPLDDYEFRNNELVNYGYIQI